MLRSDVVLEHDVAAELACDQLCKAANIGISVRNGIVTLSGTVVDPTFRHAALRAVKRVFGVDGIEERLQIAAAQLEKPASAGIGPDASL